MVNILSILHENIQVYFKYYSDSKGLLNYASFIRFYKDFGVFPRLASKAKLAKYFYALANLRVSYLFLFNNVFLFLDGLDTNLHIRSLHILTRQ